MFTRKGRSSRIPMQYQKVKVGLIARLKLFMRKCQVLKKIWIYHHSQKPKTILLETYRANLESLEKAGWSDWPSFTPEQFGLEEGDDATELGEIVKQVQTSLNQALNIDHLDQFELIAYLRDGLSQTIDHLDSVETLREKAREGSKV